MDQEVNESIQKLINDLQSFKAAVRNMDESSQQEALQSLDLVIASDRELQHALTKYKEFQRTQELLRLEEERSRLLGQKIASIAAKVLDEMSSIEASLEEDQRLLHKLQKRLQNLECLSVPSIIGLGKMLALTKGPPTNWKPGSALGSHKPPYPTEDLMRSGVLFRRMNLNIPSGLDGVTDDPQVAAVSKEIGEYAIQRGSRTPSASVDFDLLGLDLNPDLI